jgi:nitrite reductase (NO-forming)
MTTLAKPPARPTTAKPRTLRDFVALAWLAVLLVVVFAHQWIPASTWLMIHLVLLGALTHSALVWSEHFAHTLLRTSLDDDGRRRQDVRIVLLAVGSLLVFVGYPWDQWWLVVAGVVLVAVSVLWHALHLYRQLKGSLPNRFRVVSHYYIAAALMLPIGSGFGATLAFGFAEPWHGRFLIAHMAVNLLGWIGLTVTGTLVTFWPTMVRARMDDRAELLAKRALPLFLVGIAVLTGGGLVGSRLVALAGLAVYVAALVWWGRALWAPVRAKGIREFAPASVGLAMVWASIGLVWVGYLLATADDWAAVSAALPTVGGVFAAGFGAQLLFGALTYLVPSVMGGGPSVVRAGQSALHKWTTFRLVVPNLALVLWLLPTPSWVKVLVTSIGALVMATFLPLLVIGAIRSARALRAVRAGEKPEPPTEQKVWTGSGLMAGLAAILLAVTGGVALDPGAVGIATGAAGQTVAATGNVTRVEVTVEGMHFVPSRIEVPAGDQLVVEFRNTGDDVHDLVIGDARTPRLSPGQSAELDAGIIGADVEGYCSVAGHRQMGMVLDVVAIGGDSRDQAQHAATAPGTIPAVPDARLTRFVDPELPPLTDSTVHELTLVVTEEPLEVAPGIWQTRWTYNGQSVGPTLRGRVGDVFEITLVNDGTIGHSVDFHAGALAPDRPMRTIAPGEQLTYRFTATRAGIWMYHCSTMPMSSHIAAGMHGAVIIEPDGLPEVDHEYVLVQSEVYLADGAASPEEASELDAAKIAAESPDRVVFNGIANQYDLHPFEVRTGERVRFWVLAAGPNRPIAFHVVGGQFDTSWTEGGYTLNRGVAPDGATDGGAQVLPLLAAQGGFVELTFPEAGHYPVVNHVMIDAERGAHGIVKVTD